MITLEDLRKAEVAVKRQERVVSNRQKRVQYDWRSTGKPDLGRLHRADDDARALLAKIDGAAVIRSRMGVTT
mgnify:CR=1 FL=1